jgi:fluoroquinolone resistance protein
MERQYIEDKHFEGNDFTMSAFEPGNYEHCRFINCNFAEVNLSGINFLECYFDGCNLGMTKLGKTGFREIKFTGCKLLGLHFDHCNRIGLAMEFDNCILNLSSFYQLKLKGTIFTNSILHEVDLAEADLSNTVFDNCDLKGTMFDNTNIEHADFRTAYNYSIDPAKNKIKKAKFSMQGLIGLLDKYDIVIE